jgi:nucleotidyltransferase substrate binding protein (TIGR01987 family)
MARAGAVISEMDRAITSLATALEQPKTEFIRDAAIQRFEFSFELGWKSIQALAKLEGQETTSPRTAISVALRNGWIQDESLWLDMLDARNLTSHTYHEGTAEQVFKGLPQHKSTLRALHIKLSARLSEIAGI